MTELTKELCLQALYGGLLLGGGGGGSIRLGLDALEETFHHTDRLKLLKPGELSPDETVVNVSMVGAPSAKDTCVKAEHWKTAFQNFENFNGTKISGLTSCENGGVSTSNGWILSALTGIPLVDAPSNGRAHPTGMMGSMGLDQFPDYVTVQSACGGKGEKYVETVARGSLPAASHLIRQTAVASGGMCCVLRNPVSAQYAETHAAVGAIAQALEIGRGFLEHSGDVSGVLSFLADGYDAEAVCAGVTRNCALRMGGGYDAGSLHVMTGQDDYELTFWNEYMTMEKNGERIGTFPDLLCTLDALTGLPLSSAEIQDGRNVVLLKIPRNRLILGMGMHRENLFREAEKVLGKEMISYQKELFS
ncbi:S-methyl thiohydantoin desulfurase domain-containing protein [Caproicibacter sp. BJN0012]|uniref:S-methyl thiohydantoin desulfurase domain-containing protein n=1 Tax=Caproicibacter sp. BJN0012 TaxID=3110227 RepID=UPI002E162AB3